MIQETESNRTRITLVSTCPNPLFEKWLTEFIAQAEKKNAKSQFQLKKALTSLQKFPLKLNTGRDCIILEGFGKGICSLLDQKLEIYIKNQMTSGLNVGLNIVQLSESFQKSEVYQKEIEDNQEVIKKTVIKELVKDKKVSVRKNAVAKKNESKITMDPGSYEIVLLVDTQETAGKSKTHLDRTIHELDGHKIKYEIRRLSVGDFLWIAKDTLGHELVLPYIVERKRKDDLASSIKDGRYYEQKYRLKNCGLKNVIYMIESMENTNDLHLGLPIQNLMQATINTRVQNGYQVKFTENNSHSIMYLQTITEFLKKSFRDEILVSCAKQDLDKKECSTRMKYLMEFSEFNKLSMKKGDPSVKEIFIKQLLQMKGLSVEKAVAITENFSTPRELYSAYITSSEKEGENLLSNIIYGPLKKSIGPAISKAIYQLYTNKKSS